MISTSYDNGQAAIQLDEKGSGFVYYPSGGVSVVASTASEYQNRHYAFDKNRKGTILLGIDENAIGFCASTTRKSANMKESMTLVLTDRGCVVAKDAVIIYEWLWDRRAMNAGKAPEAPIRFNLNENLQFEFVDRQHMYLEVALEGGSRHRFNVGCREKRTAPSYLATAKRMLGGRLEPQIDRISLKTRQAELNQTFAALRNKLQPKSENLSEMVRDIVAELERNFDGISQRMHASPSLGATWQREALSTTISEIPRLPMMGTECGPYTGYGEHIYTAPENFEMTRSQTLPTTLVTAKGTWKNEHEILHALNEKNPPLKRSGILKANSGRYTSSLVVNPDLVTADNPTGMVVPIGLPMEDISWKKLQELNISEATHAAARSQLNVVLVLRTGDPRGCVFERVANIVNLEMEEAAARDGGAGAKDRARLLRLDVCDNCEIIKELNIREIPTFLMYRSGTLLYAGPCGGRKVKMTPTSAKPQVLIVDTDFKQQIAMEKTLRKMGCDTFLALTAAEAVDRINHVNSGINRDDAGRGGPSEIFMDLVLIANDILSPDVNVLAKRLAGAIAAKRTTVVALVSVLGEQGRHNLDMGKWEPDFCTLQIGNVVQAPLAGLVHLAMQKPVKAASIRRALTMRVVPADDSALGLTPESLQDKIKIVSSRTSDPASVAAPPPPSSSGGAYGAVDRRSGTYVGIRLSAEDVKLRGRSLIKS